MGRFPNNRPFYDDERGGNWLPVFLAALASLAIHVFLYYRVAEMRFDVTAEIPPQLRETPARRFANFERLKRDPVQPLDQARENPLSGPAGASLSQEQLSGIFDVPEVTFEAPPPQKASLEAAALREVAAAELPSEAPEWQPRQELIEIHDRSVRDDIALLPRHEIFSVDRVPAAPDYVPEVSPQTLAAQPAAAPESLSQMPLFSLPVELPPLPTSVESAAAKVFTDPAATPAESLADFGEKPDEISEFRHVDNRLSTSLAVYVPPAPDPRKYFRLEINPSLDSGLDVVGKDVVFVQDASRSLASERLHFCKQGLKDALASVSARDRFNVVSFREDATFCFGTQWALPTGENFARAFAFIDSLDSRGDTDLFRSLKSLMALPRDPERPLIVIVVTDGKATTGITASSKIIGEFSKLNDNMSLYVLGTHAKANAYLLDLLSFCNRGRQSIVRSDRWSIPQAVKALADSCSRPLLGRVSVDADVDSRAEFFPLPSANLYAGEPLVYYGSCPKETGAMTIQIRGEGGASKVDCIFEIDFTGAPRADAKIRGEWARRKMHSLLGEHARNPSPGVVAAMRRLSAETGEPIPYAGEF